MGALLDAARKTGEQQSAVRKTRTLYVREEDQLLWDKAKELIGDSLSTYLTNHLKGLVESSEAAAKGFERIVVKFRESGIPVAKAFYGRWLIPPEERYSFEDPNEWGGEAPSFAVALTAKNNIVVFQFGSVIIKGSRSDLGPGHHNFDWGSLDVYSSFEDSKKTTPDYVVAEAMIRQGIAVQELDI